MEVEGSSKKMIATQAEMVEAKVPIPYRDQCAHLLIPLNKCRQAELYLPWKCETERHIYEKAARRAPFLSFPTLPMLLRVDSRPQIPFGHLEIAQMWML
nr:nadh dehydrogenase [ubiquinone] 1 beta subcomplex subunit 7 [Quercus suber]